MDKTVAAFGFGGLVMLLIAFILIPASAGREMNIPPTNAFSVVVTNGANITSASYDSVAHLNYPYAQISDGTTQNSISGAAKNVTLNTNDVLYRITHSTTTNTNEIKIQEAGVYQVIAVPQVGEAGPGQASGTHDFWMMKNNAKVANSNIKTTVATQQASGQTMTGTVNWVGYLNVNDIVSFQQSADDSDIGIIFTAAGVPPATPSIIISIARIS